MAEWGNFMRSIAGELFPSLWRGGPYRQHIVVRGGEVEGFSGTVGP